MTTNWNRDKHQDRPYFTHAERRTVLRRDHSRCYNCNSRATEVDHVNPVAEGGAHSLDNAAAICTSCHKIKTRNEALRGYARRQAKLKLPEDPHPFGDSPL